ncbi:unnamed protein product, partial [Symbiodinium microadriaticum]
MKPASGALAALTAALLGTCAAWATIRLGDPAAEPAVAVATGANPVTHGQEAAEPGVQPGQRRCKGSKSNGGGPHNFDEFHDDGPYSKTQYELRDLRSFGNPLVGAANSGVARSKHIRGAPGCFNELHDEDPYGQTQHEPYDFTTKHHEPYGDLHLGNFYRTGRRESGRSKRARTSTPTAEDCEPFGNPHTDEYYSTGRREQRRAGNSGPTARGGNQEPERGNPRTTATARPSASSTGASTAARGSTVSGNRASTPETEGADSEGTNTTTTTGMWRPRFAPPYNPDDDPWQHGIFGDPNPESQRPTSSHQQPQQGTGPLVDVTAAAASAGGDFTATAASSSSGESAPGPPQKEPPKPRQPPPAADFRHSQPTALYRQVFGHGRDPPATPAGSTAIAGHPVQEDDLEHEEPPETAAAAAAAAESPSQTTDDAWEKLRASLQHLDADPIVGTRQEPEPSLAPGQQHGSQPLHQQQEPLTGEAPHQPQIQPPAEEQATAAATSSRARSASTQRRGAQDPPQQVHRLPPLEPWSRKRRPWQQPPRQIPQKQHDFHDRADPQGGDPPAQEAEPSQQPAAEGPHHEAQPDAPQHASGERQSRHPGTLAHSTFTSTSSSSRSRRRPRPQPPQMRPEKAHNETTGTVATQQQGKLPRTTNGHQHGGPPLTQRTRKLSPIRGRRQTARSTAAHPAGTSEATSSSGRKGNAQLARPTRRGHRTPQPSNGDDIPPALETREPAIKQTKRGSTRNLRNERQTPARTHQPGLFTKLLNLHLQPRTPPQGTPQQTGPSDPTAASSTQAPHMPQQGTQAQSAGPQQEDPTSKQATLAQQQAEERMQQPGPKAAAKGT